MLDGYQCYCVPHKESVASNRKSRRGRGVVCLFLKENLSKGVTITNTIVETDSRGFIWAKFAKNYFKIDDTIYMRFAYIPPSDSVYFKAHERDFFEQLEAHIMKYSTLGKVSIFW